MQRFCRFSYLGLGEPLCFTAFGVCAVASAFTAMCRSIDMSAPAVELLQQHAALVAPVMVVCGLTTTTILFCSHFHQIEGDKSAGKMSPLVRLGTEKGCKVCCWLSLHWQCGGSALVAVVSPPPPPPHPCHRCSQLRGPFSPRFMSFIAWACFEVLCP